MMANAVADGLQDKGISYKMLDLQVNHRSDVMSDVLEASAIVLGCPTLNNGMLPRMAGFLMYMRGLRPTNKIGAAFGSYGWSGEAVKLMNKSMDEMKFILVHKGLKVQYVPDHGHLKEAVELGHTVGQALNDLADGKEVLPAE